MSELADALDDIQDALSRNDWLAAGKAHTKAGQIFLARNLYQEAAQHYQEASNLFDSIGENKLMARSLNHLGICLVMTKDSDAALDHFRKALSLLENSPDDALAAAIWGNTGLAYSNQSDHKNAIKAHKLVLEAAEESGDDSLRLKALINLADSNLQDKNLNSAQGFALVAQDLAREISSLSGLVIIYDLLGMISSHQGDLQSAVGYHQESFQTAQKIGDLLRQGIALANKGLALERLTDLDGALEAMGQAEQLFALLHSDYLEKTREDLERVRSALA
jgi:tetratricopeptide (TPR) repeat protein